MVPEPSLTRKEVGEFLLLGAVTFAAILWMFWGLGQPYLWQDEAQTAVLAERMMRFGKPLAYDGRNLVTMDYLVPAERAAAASHVGEPLDTVRWYAARGDFKADTTWIGHPWGQFLAAGLSMASLGKSTVAARAPFALASVLSVLVLFLLVRSVLRNQLTAALAVALLLTSAYWVLHGRQCRYYALSTLFGLTTVAAFVRWQAGGRLGGPLLVASAWGWFQCDFGSFWPGTLPLLFLGAVSRPGWRAAARATAALAVGVAPFVVFYRLAGRLKIPWESWTDRFLGLLFNLNQFVVPLVVLAGVAWAYARRRRTLEPRASGLLVACGTVLAATLFWSATVVPWHYHRYLVHLTPLACVLASWGLVEAGAWCARVLGERRLASATALTLGAFVALSPMASNLLSWAMPIDRSELHPLGTFVRGEIGVAARALLGLRPDPNAEAIALVQARARPEDEILVNYEDLPFVFYTDHRIRGEIPAFRVQDPAGPPPRFLVLRPSVHFVLWPVFIPAINRYRWAPIPSRSPGVFWGNNPDPNGQGLWTRKDLQPLVVAERAAEIPSSDSH